MVSVYEIRGKRDAALLVLRKRFGELPEGAEARVRRMETNAEVEARLKAIIHAQSLADLGLEESGDTRPRNGA